MRIKEYMAFKSIAKTAKVNNLIKADRKRLFDFAMFDEMPIPETEKEILKTNALQYVAAGSKALYYRKSFNDFTACDGIADFYSHKVYDKDGRYLYSIFQLARVKHSSCTRNCVYDEYEVTNYERSCGYTEPIDDIEI